MTASDASGALWRFAVDLYGSEGVADACLTLQDDFGADVRLLLFAAWRPEALTPQRMAEVVPFAEGFGEEVVAPLRAVRRVLKGSDLPGAEALRTRVKTVELEAERLQLDELERRTQGWTGPAGDVAANLRMAFEPPSAEAAHLLDIIAAAARGRA
jgi:uncharacterized protein (TIGR02444 family)